MGLQRGKGWWWRFFKNEFFNLHTAVKGNIVLSYGMHSLVINIDPNIDPIEIYVNCIDDEMPVCVGGVSLVSAQLNDDQTFTLTANVASNTCTIGWILEYDPVVD